MIKKIQLPDDAFVGNWSMIEEGILVTQEGFSRVMIPACPHGDFEVHLELTRKHWKLPKKNIGLGAHDDEVVFHDLRLIQK